MTGCPHQRPPTRALPGSRHDIAAAREHGIPGALAKAGISTVADTSYQGAGLAARMPQRRRRQAAPRSRFPLTNPVVRSRCSAPCAEQKAFDLRKPVRRVGIEPTTRWLGVA